MQGVNEGQVSRVDFYGPNGDKAYATFFPGCGKRPPLKCKKRNLQAFRAGKAAGGEQAVSKTAKLA